MGKLFLYERRKGWIRRWLLFLLAAILSALQGFGLMGSGVSPIEAGKSLLEWRDLLPHMGRLVSQAPSLLFFLLPVFLEAFQSLSVLYRTRGSASLTLSPLSWTDQIVGRFCSVMGTLGLSLGLCALWDQLLVRLVENRLGPGLGSGAGMTSGASFPWEDPAFLVAILVQGACLIALLFFVQSLGRLLLGPRGGIGRFFRPIPDLLIMLVASWGLSLGAKRLIARWPLALSLSHFQLLRWQGQPEFIPFLWAYQGPTSRASLLVGEGGLLWALPLLGLLILTLFALTASVWLAEDHIDY